MTGGEAIVQSLIAQGVDPMFGLPGVQNDFLYNALYDAGDRIRLLHTRHEQGAAYMALGYALATGGVGVYNVVPGPGLLNTTAALATALSTNARVLCLTGQIASNSIGRGYGLLHEIPDQLGIMRSLTKWSARINSPAEAPELVAEAFRQLQSGRPQPVGLEVPPDVLAATAEVDPSPVEPQIRALPLDVDAIERAAELLASARNPIIFVGSGALDAANSVRALAEALQAPVVSNRSGHGILSSRHPLALRSPEAHVLWPRADVVLGVGTRMQVPLVNWGTDEQLKLIRIDVDPVEMNRIATPEVAILARSEDALPALAEAVARRQRERASRAEELEGLRAEVAGRNAFLEPQLSFLQAIRAALPDDGFFVEEMTQVSYVSRFALPVYEPRTFVSVGYQGTLGWGFATALGVKVACPDRAVLSVSGDGGFMFTMQELATAVQHGIATVNVVFNDGAFGNVQRMQKERYGGRVIATDLHNPDFIKLAEAFGAQGMRVHSPDELGDALRQGFDSDLPTLIEVPVGTMPSPWAVSFLPKVRPAH
jgi:acetolactate synthase-1/2/3 large subunit